MMKAVVLYSGGPPESLKLEQRPIPKATSPGQLLIHIRAFGLNRSELFTRLGQSPNVKLPRILGIECVGEVASCPGQEFKEGDVVATCMGGLGREVDGGYAEYTLIKAEYARRVDVKWPRGEVDWKLLGALPEMLQTSWGSLNRFLKVQREERFLVRGATTSVGQAACAIAKSQGVFVVGTTRREDRRELLLRIGCDEVVVDDGRVAVKLGEEKKVDKVLELVGSTLQDSARCLRSGGVVCQVGVVGGNSDRKLELPEGARYGFYGGEQEDFQAMPLNELIQQVIDGKLPVTVGKVFHIDEIVEAHRTMEGNSAGGKIVVLT